jgi:alkylation response protein AidB-like acyl-CoA dehydrogenase
MDFALSEEQALLRDSVRRFLAKAYPFERRIAALRSDSGMQSEIWSAFANQLGLLGIGVSPELGGAGGGDVEHMLVMQELGRALVVEPYLETVVVGAAALAADAGPLARDILVSLIAGKTRLAFAWAEPDTRFSFTQIGTLARRDGASWRLSGHKSMVTGGPWADRLLVLARTSGSSGEANGLSLFVVDKSSAGLTEHAFRTIDGRRAADLKLEHVAVPGEALLCGEGQAAALVEDLLDRGVAAVAAESLGAMEKILADTLAYAKQRKQFGQPLASFQVLQHRIADMFMQLELARSAAYLATLKLGAPPRERMRAASSAKTCIANACRFVGQNAIQLHGGMGMTNDLALSHYFRRTTVIEGEFGAADEHLSRLAKLSRSSNEFA